MKRFLLFAGRHYYPAGGVDDFIGAYDTIEHAMMARPNCDWAHVAATSANSGEPVKVAFWELTPDQESAQWLTIFTDDAIARLVGTEVPA